MAEGLQIVIGAEVAPAVKGLKTVNAELAKTASVEKGLSAAIGSANKSLSSLKPGANQAANALQDLGRIAQDAPFGFIGISNNINPLLESFQRLKAESGSTKGALQALVGSLAGGAGLGLAVSVATGLLTVFGSKIFKIGDDTKKAKEETDQYSKSLDSISAGLGEEATRIGVLVKAVQSDTLSKEQRNGAIKELKQLNPDYFGDLKEEAGLVGRLQLAYTAYISSLKQQFAAKALDKQIAELFDKKTKIEAEIDPALSADSNKQLSTILSRYQGEFDKLGGIKAFTAIPIDQSELTSTQKRLRELFKLIQDIRNTKTYDPEAVKTTKDLDDINTRIDGLLARRAKLENFDIDTGSGKTGGRKKEEEDSLQKRISQLEALKAATGLLKIEEEELLEVRIAMASRDATKNGLDAGQLQRTIQQLADNADLEVEIKPKFLVPPAAVINTDLAVVGRELKPLSIQVTANTKMAEDKLKAFQDAMQSGLTSAVSSIAQGLGDVLGEALSGGNPLAAGLALIADTLVQLGKAAVGAGIAMLSLKTLFKNPATAIAAGIAAIALGTAIKSSIPKFAEGGVVTGPTMGLIGEAGPEVIFPLSKLNQFIGSMNKGSGDAMTVEHKVQGQDLLLVINRAQNRWGGSNRI